MINIEYKLDIFNQIVLKEQEAKAKEELEALEKSNNEIFEQKRKELEKNKEELINRRIQLAETQKNEMISKATQENRETLLAKREEILHDLILSLEKKAKEFTETPEYNSYFINKVKRYIEGISDNQLVITILEKDKERYGQELNRIAKELGKDIEIEIVIDQKIGGFIITDKNRTYNLDSTFKTIIEEQKYHIGKALYSSLEEVGEIHG